MVACVSCTLQFVANIVMPFSVDIYMFAALRFVDGFFAQAIYPTVFVIVLEMVGPSKRHIPSTMILMAFCVGNFVLVGLGYFIRDWRWLQLALAAPMIISVFYWWKAVLPESPRWLISRGRTEEAMKIIRKMASVNKKELSEDIKTIKVEEENDEGLIAIMKSLFQSKTLVIRWIIVLINWFVISFIYYGVTLNISFLGEDLYLTFFINAIVETVGYCLQYFIYKTGRKKMYLTTMFAMGVFFVTSVFTDLYLDPDSDLAWITVALTMIGKMFISLVYGIIYVFTGELFPTVVRGGVLGVCAFSAAIGSLITPYLYELDINMDYDDVLKEIDDYGPFQKRLLTITLIPIVYNAFGGSVNNFILGNHKYRCKIPWLPNDTYKIQNEFHSSVINETIPLKKDGSYESCYIINNGTKEKCHDWVFDFSVFTQTVNSQYKAVCNDELLVNHATMSYYFGGLVAAVILTPLSDLFVMAFIYYGVTLNIGSLGENLYLTYTINAVVEMLGNCLQFFLNKTGRRRMYLANMISMAVFFVASVFTNLYINPNSDLNWITVTLTMVGKLLISLGYGIIYVYTGELFPTVVRGGVIGMCAFAAAVASLITPYLYELGDGKMKTTLPLILYAATTIVAAVSSAFLPETTNVNLQEKIKNVDDNDKVK
ncbi:hypothetical protein FSP39_019225 [Pinctada imbricata]|uniref:Major facilitator superfamily (MFS) profile domain-containing protein n=1 Tax=Pinctada imbricata TaxID=66713 RepID=A0AA88Y624_PINIB|nr:hypothetical protein FSP39_019225 [Pinctada imbricata]